MSISSNESTECFPAVTEEVSMGELNDRYIEWMLKKYDNNKYEAARRLKISVRTLYNRLNKKKAING